MIIVGLLFQGGLTLISVKLLMILFFMLITSPTSCHALAKSALVNGVQAELDVAPEDCLTAAGIERGECEPGAGG